MQKRVLITGGAGFIGSHLTDELLKNNYRVRVLDNLNPQVHGPGNIPPDYLTPEAEFVYGDVCNPSDVRSALKGVSAVFHFAACVGVGQSMYEIEKYTRTNNLGTAVLLEALAEQPVEKLVAASSMSIYGEGWYQSESGPVSAVNRDPDQLKKGRWELFDVSGNPLKPVATPESKPPHLMSLYALSKYDQEKMCLMIGAAYAIPTVALRFFNVYGPRQSISNPYTGVLAIFASRILNGKAPLIFEDGLQKRDFVSVYDVSRACRLALQSPAADYQAFNIGSGNVYTVCEIAEKVAAVLGQSDIRPVITGKYRVGDIRHCFADISLARRELGYAPQVSLEQGLADLAGWLQGKASEDRVEEAAAELARRGLAVAPSRDYQFN